MKRVMPMQPIVNGRFIQNRIVTTLLDRAPIGLNEIACMNFTQSEREQFAQLIGYSLSGFGELSYASDDIYEIAEKMDNGKSETDAKVEHFQETLNDVRIGMKEIIPCLFRIHPDDLKV